MKRYLSFLQAPYAKIFFAPLGTILFGLITGSVMGQKINLYPIILLYLIVFSGAIIQHYHGLTYLKPEESTKHVNLMTIVKIIMIVLTILFMLTQHWIINVLIGFYLLYHLLQLDPLNMVGSPYYLILNIFFHSFLLNAVAFYSQAEAINLAVLGSFIPLILTCTGIEILNGQLLNFSFYKKSTLVTRDKLHHLVLVVLLLGLSLAVYLSLPSQSFFIVQLLFIILGVFFTLPVIVSVREEDKRQNKINYLSSLSTIYGLIYSLSFLL